MKGIILSGGLGTRLYPTTQVISKQILPVYDKPMIYYPLSILMLVNIRDILIISTPKDIKYFEKLFGDGKQLGLNIAYKVQEKPKGLAEALIIGEEFIQKDSVCLILGDNIIYGERLPYFLEESIKENTGATIFGYYVNDPSSYGVVELDKKGKVLGVEEKPKKPKSNYAIIGLYIYNNKATEIAKKIKPSARGELEITDVNKEYFKKGKLKVKLFSRGTAWLDCGTIEDLHEASTFVRVIENRQGLKIACIEEVAYRKGYISLRQLKKLIKPLAKSQYGKYLLTLIKREKV